MDKWTPNTQPHDEPELIRVMGYIHKIFMAGAEPDAVATAVNDIPLRDTFLASNYAERQWGRNREDEAIEWWVLIREVFDALDGEYRAKRSHYDALFVEKHGADWSDRVPTEIPDVETNFQPVIDKIERDILEDDGRVFDGPAAERRAAQNVADISALHDGGVDVYWPVHFEGVVARTALLQYKCDIVEFPQYDAWYRIQNMIDARNRRFYANQ